MLLTLAILLAFAIAETFAEISGRVAPFGKNLIAIAFSESPETTR
jgi:hypothetical protein